MIRIVLILAIICGLGVAGVNFFKVKQVITTTRAERDEWHGKFDKTDADLRISQKNLTATKAELATTQANLKTSQEAQAKAEADAAEKVKLAVQLQESVKKLQGDLGTANAELAAYRGTGLTPEQALNAAKQIRDGETRLAEQKIINDKLGRDLLKTTVELKKYTEKEYVVPLPADLTGKVIVSDPKWDFVILNVGEDQNVLKDGELLVNRSGRLVAKLKITAVEKDRSIANVMPGWKLGDVMEGDQVFPAYLPQ